MQVWLAALCGKILKLDHSFKVVKRVRDSTAHKQFGAVLSIMNELCQVRFSSICHGSVQCISGSRAAAGRCLPCSLFVQVLASFPADTKSLSELAPELKKLAENYEKMGKHYEEVNFQAGSSISGDTRCMHVWCADTGVSCHCLVSFHDQQVMC